jgi:HK97 family phage major capsid protein
MPYNSLISRNDMGGLIPVEYSREIIKATVEQSAVLRLARRLADMPTNTRVLPVISALPAAYFVTGDTGLKQTTEVNWQGVTLTAEELAVIVPIPQAALDDANYPIWDEIKPALVEALGLAIDQAILFGTNKPASWPTDLLNGATAASNTVALGSVGTDLFDDIMAQNGVIGKVEADGFMVTGHIAGISMRARLRALRDQNHQPIFVRSLQETVQFELDGVPILFPLNGCMNEASALMFSGDWSQLVYAVRQDINYMIADQGVISDANGSIVYNLFQQDMVALRVVMRLGFQLPNPVTRLNATATRYPFAVLVPA